MLASLGFAGRPFEHLWDPEGTEPEPLATRWARVCRAATGDNGVFGLKLMWYQADRLERELPEALGRPDTPLVELLDATLTHPRYVYLTRRDHLRQAISLVRAMQTGRWRSMHGTACTPHYDVEAIRGALHFLEEEERTWEDFFARNSLVPYRLAYEELDAAPDRAVTSLLRYLGHEDSEITLPPTQHRRQADALTEEWAERFASERSRPAYGAP